MNDLLDGLVLIGRLLLRALLALLRLLEFLSFLGEVGSLIASGWRRLRRRREKAP